MKDRDIHVFSCWLRLAGWQRCLNAHLCSRVRLVELVLVSPFFRREARKIVWRSFPSPPLLSPN
jgi:hypothetical protein